MQQDDVRWKQRFENYKRALNQLETALHEYADTNLDIIKEGIIQRFEFTHELAWKLMQDILQAEGVADILGSRTTTRMAFNRGLIQQGDIWLEMVKSRNITVHTYDEKILAQEFSKIMTLYLPLFLQFKQRVEKLCQNLD
ncbi:nucleotidyltransferase substrate binding protein [Aggregatibacter actinomycetemcomitans serotype e str. SC1083]|uniref:Nucleotidyltransferase substrate binding protein n=1 Tax=Aggregatibacter actinomycetemcomitans serotype e str. SC1083 TaxID=907488 RepID=G4A9Z7_AGGAC|nr:nucleotidyltransferase substrate binding protein [Aggregatibacter actinomycetemcomitans]EGY33109.1 nucleotidyltransferase substrate binding protein [Aggregatibacter actinomycetemcomitans serotype e str. SC1083]KYK74158.1 nucleotidyltransferase [Aggregatibacter actinomycetemcomitans serotype e str. SA3096]KYK80894.1 nucleotidyltransferase [Aggregatibacter actinomycetemcomitans serotype e str. SC936]KYK96761.1 nucleotidyltransferase [Aggregatibacter actinomycetemcomitans serotype e str. ANH977